MKNIILKAIDILKRNDIDLINKLNNMLGSEISKETFDICIKEENFKNIENEIWNLLNNHNDFSRLDFFEGLAYEYIPLSDHDLWTACLYNCDLIYSVAIKNVIGLEE